MSDIKWSESPSLDTVWVEDLEEPHLSAFCEDGDGVYFVIDTGTSMGNFSDVEEGILKIHYNPIVLKNECIALTQKNKELLRALEKIKTIQVEEQPLTYKYKPSWIVADKALKEHPACST